MKKRRYWVKVIKRILALALIIIAIVIASNVIYNFFFDNEKENKKTEEAYEAEKERHEQIRIIADKLIKEGKEIKISTISKIDGIEYKIYNSGEKIIFYYEIDDVNNFDNSNLACATIILSNDFEILDEEYSELQDFEAYKQHTKVMGRVLSFGLAIVVAVIIVGICTTFKFFIWLFIEVKKEKNQTNTDS